MAPEWNNNKVVILCTNFCELLLVITCTVTCGARADIRIYAPQDWHCHDHWCTDCNNFLSTETSESTDNTKSKLTFSEEKSAKYSNKMNIKLSWSCSDTRHWFVVDLELFQWPECFYSIIIFKKITYCVYNDSWSIQIITKRLQWYVVVNYKIREPI